MGHLGHIGRRIEDYILGGSRTKVGISRVVLCYGGGVSVSVCTRYGRVPEGAECRVTNVRRPGGPESVVSCARTTALTYSLTVYVIYARLRRVRGFDGGRVQGFMGRYVTLVGSCLTAKCVARGSIATVLGGRMGFSVENKRSKGRRGNDTGVKGDSVGS